MALVAGDIVADSEANHHRDEEAHVERHDSLRTSAAPLMMMLSALTHLLAAAKKDIPTLPRRNSIQLQLTTAK